MIAQEMQAQLDRTLKVVPGGDPGITPDELLAQLTGIILEAATSAAEAEAAATAAEGAETSAQAAQAAAEAAAASSSYLITGFGISGSVAVLSNLDATTTISGETRYDNTTAGTFPAGVVKATGGTIRTERRTSTSFTQYLKPVGQSRVYIRDYEGSFGAWYTSNGKILRQAAAFPAAATFDTLQLPQNWSEASFKFFEISSTTHVGVTFQFFNSAGAMASVSNCGYSIAGTTVTNLSTASLPQLFRMTLGSALSGEFRFWRNPLQTGLHNIQGEMKAKNEFGGNTIYESSFNVQAATNSDTEGPGLRLTVATGVFSTTGSFQLEYI